MNIFFPLVLLFLLFSALSQGCNLTNSRRDMSGNELKVAVPNLIVRNAPDIQSPEVLRLKQGDKLIYADSISQMVNTMSIDGSTFTQPWLLVYGNGFKGWVFGGGLSFDDSLHAAIIAQIDKRVLEHYFGRKLALDIEYISPKYRKITTVTDIAQSFIKSNELRDSLVQKLELIGSKDNFAEVDLNPLTQKLDFLVPEMVAEGRSLYLFQNYKYWLKASKKSKEKEDDLFFELMVKIYPDSLEGFYPSWFMQTWDYGGCSKLGQNIHLYLLGQFEKTLLKSPSFRYCINELKKSLIQDIIESSHFSETKEKALLELKTIVSQNYSLITHEEKVALEVRLAQLKVNTAGVSFESFGSE